MSVAELPGFGHVCPREEVEIQVHSVFLSAIVTAVVEPCNTVLFVHCVLERITSCTPW